MPHDASAAWRSLHETHLANLRSHRALLDHLATTATLDKKPALDAMRARAERIWEDAVRAGEMLMADVEGGAGAGATGSREAEQPEEATRSQKRRRISSGLEVEAAGSANADEEGEDVDEAENMEEEEQEEEEEEGDTGEMDRADLCVVVVANIPPGVTASDVWHHLRDYNPIAFKHPIIRAPTRAEIHLYDLPLHAHGKGLIKIRLRSASSVAAAAADLNGKRLYDFHNRRICHHASYCLIVRRYVRAADDAAPPIGRMDGNKKRARRSASAIGTTVGSGDQEEEEEHLERTSKRLRMDNNAGAALHCNSSSSSRPASTAAASGGPTYPFTFTAAVPPQPPQPPPPPAVQEEEPEFEDISAEVDARLLEQAAKRAAARAKASGAAAAVAAPVPVGKKRRSEEVAEDQEGDEATIAGIAGMALVDGRPKKRMRETRRGGGEGSAAAGFGNDEGRQQQQPQVNEVPASKARGKKGMMKVMRESPRPTKRPRRSA